jgi:uncharacterized membrane protein YfcA
MDFTIIELILLGLIFLWTGFVRTGLGFGGAALGLPLMLILGASPVYWLPIIGLHLLFFVAISLSKSLKNVDWIYLKKTLIWIIPPVLLGVLGLVALPQIWMIIFVYTITIFYAIVWIFARTIQSNKLWVDKFLLIVGGYVAGTSLTGAPLLVVVFMRHISKSQLRDSLFVLWFILVSIKMSAFMALGVNIDWRLALLFLPIAGLGHWIGLGLHQRIIKNDTAFKRWVGVALLLISTFGLLKVLMTL